MYTALHHHSHFSTYDGFGTAKQAATRAAELRYTGLALTDHGNVCGVVEHYFACKDAGIKPILGVEGYFQPQFDPKKQSFHLIILAQNMAGYHNLMAMLSEANATQYYRRPIIDFDMLERYSEGLIVLSACLSGVVARSIEANLPNLATKLAQRFQSIFGDRYYLEMQPFPAGEQKKVNETLLKIGEKLGLQLVITTDSHYVSQTDYSSYQIAKSNGGEETRLSADYSKRFLPSVGYITKHWQQMMGTNPQKWLENTDELAARCKLDLSFPEVVPTIEWDKPSQDKMVELAVSNLKSLGKWNPQYRDRLRQEVKVIVSKGFEDYMLLCYDITRYAKEAGVGVNFGRGSVCGSLLALGLGITKVDPILLGTSFERFLRPDKVTLPDIDMDFASSGRDRIVDYVLKRYQGRAAQIATFGYYRVRNLVADLAKVYEMPQGERELFAAELEVAVGDEVEEIDETALMHFPGIKQIERKYPGIVHHFSRMHGQVRFHGRHAGGIAISSGDISQYTAVMKVRDRFTTSFDMKSLAKLNVVKVDVLGLTTADIVFKAEKLAGVTWDDSFLDDEEVYRQFTQGHTEGIFQFEKRGAKDVLAKVKPGNIQELIACNALNRPAPIQLGVLDDYVSGKNGGFVSTSLVSPYTSDSYGCIIYQEHVMGICRGVANMDWPDVDKVMKSLRQFTGDGTDPLEEKFVQGAITHSGIDEEDARSLYKRMTLYLFNKGHGAGYTLLSFYAMWLKVHHPLPFYYAILSSEADEFKRLVYTTSAARSGIVVLLPHVNGGAEYRITTLEGNDVIQEGMTSLKNVGMIAARHIEERGPFTSHRDFKEKVEKRKVNSRVEAALMESGALEFRGTQFMNRVVAYNSAAYARNGMSVH